MCVKRVKMCKIFKINIKILIIFNILVSFCFLYDNILRQSQVNILKQTKLQKNVFQQKITQKHVFTKSY